MVGFVDDYFDYFVNLNFADWGLGISTVDTWTYFDLNKDIDKEKDK